MNDPEPRWTVGETQSRYDRDLARWATEPLDQSITTSTQTPLLPLVGGAVLLLVGGLLMAFLIVYFHHRTGGDLEAIVVKSPEGFLPHTVTPGTTLTAEAITSHQVVLACDWFYTDETQGIKHVIRENVNSDQLIEWTVPTTLLSDEVVIWAEKRGDRWDRVASPSFRVNDILQWGTLPTAVKLDASIVLPLSSHSQLPSSNALDYVIQATNGTEAFDALPRALDTTQKTITWYASRAGTWRLQLQYSSATAGWSMRTGLSSPLEVRNAFIPETPAERLLGLYVSNVGNYFDGFLGDSEVYLNLETSEETTDITWSYTLNGGGWTDWTSQVTLVSASGVSRVYVVQLPSMTTGSQTMQVEAKWTSDTNHYVRSHPFTIQPDLQLVNHPLVLTVKRTTPNQYPLLVEPFDLTFNNSFNAGSLGEISYGLIDDDTGTSYLLTDTTETVSGLTIAQITGTFSDTLPYALPADQPPWSLAIFLHYYHNDRWSVSNIQALTLQFTGAQYPSGSVYYQSPEGTYSWGFSGGNTFDFSITFTYQATEGTWVADTSTVQNDTFPQGLPFRDHYTLLCINSTDSAVNAYNTESPQAIWSYVSKPFGKAGTEVNLRVDDNTFTLDATTVDIVRVGPNHWRVGNPDLIKNLITDFHSRNMTQYTDPAQFTIETLQELVLF